MISKSEIGKLVHAFVSSRVDYCYSLFVCFDQKAVNGLQTAERSSKARNWSKEMESYHPNFILFTLVTSSF